MSGIRMGGAFAQRSSRTHILLLRSLSATMSPHHLGCLRRFWWRWRRATGHSCRALLLPPGPAQRPLRSESAGARCACEGAAASTRLVRANCLVPAANSFRAAAVHMALPSAPRQSVCASLAGYHQLLWLQMPFQMGHPLTHLQCARCGWTLTGLRCCCDRWMRWQSWLRQCAVYSSSCLMHPRSVLLRLQAAPLTRNPMSEA